MKNQPVNVTTITLEKLIAMQAEQALSAKENGYNSDVAEAIKRKYFPDPKNRPQPKY